jgi:hypothetical protein
MLCDCAVKVESASLAPHIPQKRNSVGLGLWHTGQTWLRGLPHIPQKIIPAGQSKPQLAHFIGKDRLVKKGASHEEQRPVGFYYGHHLKLHCIQNYPEPAGDLFKDRDCHIAIFFQQPNEIPTG